MSAGNSEATNHRAALIKSGIVTEEELRQREERAAKAAAQKGTPESACPYRDPYFLSGLDFDEATGAARWDWDVSKTHLFCSWAQKALRDRFCVDVTVDAGPEGSAEPDRLWIRYGDKEEVCNWRNINRSRWMGAFCIMANRVLEPLGVTALELDTGGFDTVVCFCRREYVDRIRGLLPVAE